MIRRVAILALAGCVDARPIPLPPEIEDFASMILAVTSGDALRVTAHELPLDEPIEEWTASGSIQLAAFLYREPLAALVEGLVEGEMLDFGAMGQPIPEGMTYVSYGESWSVAKREALADRIRAFRVGPPPTACPEITAVPISIPCNEVGEHPWDTVVMMLPSGPNQAYVTTSRGCAYLIDGEQALPAERPERPYAWLSGIPIEGGFLVTGDDGAVSELVVTGTTVETTTHPRTKPDPQDHPVRLGIGLSERYAVTFHGALWRDDEDRWTEVATAPKGDSPRCAAPYAECHEQRTLAYLSGMFISNRRPTILRASDDGVVEEQVDLPGSGLVTSLLRHPEHGMLAAHGSAPASIILRGEDRKWSLLDRTEMIGEIYAMVPVDDGIVFAGQQGQIGYVEPGSDCDVAELAQGQLNHLISIGPGVLLAGGDPQGMHTLAVYRLTTRF
jgi:hypothetical protein